MPRPDQQPQLNAVSDSTQLYTQLGSGDVRVILAGLLKSYILEGVGQVQSGSVDEEAQTLTLTLSNGDQVVIPGICCGANSGMQYIVGVGVPATILGSVGDLYLNAANGDVYKKDDVALWTKIFDFCAQSAACGGGGGGGLVVNNGPFIDDEAAGAGGVAVGGYYCLTGDTPYGTPHCIRRRQV